MLPYLAGSGDYWGRKSVGEEVGSGTLSQQVNQLPGSGGVTPGCPAQGLAQRGVDDVYLA